MVPVSDLPLADLFISVYIWIDDAYKHGTLVIPPRPGPTPACSDTELLTIALVRHLLARPSESAFLREVRRDWAHYFPHLPVQSEVNRRLRWLWGAFEQLRRLALEALPPDGWQHVDTTALPVKHPSRVRGPDSWVGPDDLVAGFGWDAAHHEWFYGLRLALRTDLGHRVVRSWGIVSAAVDERVVADGLVEGSRLDGLLLDRGFCGRTWADRYRQQGIHVLLTPSRAERRQLSAAVLGRSQTAMEGGFRRVLERLPFPLKELHPDNGSEFFWRSPGALLW